LTKEKIRLSLSACESSKSYTPPFLIFRLTFAFPPSNFLGIFIRVVSFRSFTLFVYARFLRPQSLIVVVGVVVRALLLIHYFIFL
jgi:hypothetical protein